MGAPGGSAHLRAWNQLVAITAQIVSALHRHLDVRG